MIIYYLIGIIITSILFSVLLYFAYTKKVKLESEDFKEPKDPILGRLDSASVEEYTPVGEELKKIPIYILNLEKEKERKVHTENLLNKLGFTNYTFVIPVSLKDTEKSPELWDVGMPMATKSHVLSYTFCMKKAIENNYKEFIIMEDDLDVYYDDVSITDVYRAAKNVDWDLLYYEFCFENCSRTIKINRNLYKLESPNCAGFILFNLESAKRILAEFTFKTRDTSIIDLTFQTLSKKKKINSYGFPILRQKDTFGSSIPSSYTYTRKNKFSPICRIKN